MTLGKCLLIILACCSTLVSAQTKPDSSKDLAVSLRLWPGAIILGGEWRMAPKWSLEAYSVSGITRRPVIQDDTLVVLKPKAALFYVNRLEVKYFFGKKIRHHYFHEGFFTGCSSAFKFRSHVKETGQNRALSGIFLAPFIGFEQKIFGVVYAEFRLGSNIVHLNWRTGTPKVSFPLLFSTPLSSLLSIKYTF